MLFRSKINEINKIKEKKRKEKKRKEKKRKEKKRKRKEKKIIGRKKEDMNGEGD